MKYDITKYDIIKTVKFYIRSQIRIWIYQILLHSGKWIQSMTVERIVAQFQQTSGHKGGKTDSKTRN